MSLKVGQILFLKGILFLLRGCDPDIFAPGVFHSWFRNPNNKQLSLGFYMVFYGYKYIYIYTHIYINLVLYSFII